MINRMGTIEKLVNNKTARDCLLLFVARISIIITSLGQAMILSRFLSKSDYGMYAQGIIVFTLVSSITGFGLSNAINFFGFKPEGKNQYFTTIFGLTALVGIIGGILVIVLQGCISNYFSNPYLANLIIIIAFRPAIANLTMNFHNLYVIHSKAEFIAFSNVITGIIQLLVTSLLMLFNQNVKEIFFSLLLIDCCQLIYIAHYSQKVCCKLIFQQIDRSLLKEISAFSLPLYIALIIGTLNVEIGKLIIAHSFSIDKLAEYTNMARELPFSFIVPVITTIILPRIIEAAQKKNKKKLLKIWSNAITLGLIFSWVLGSAALLLSHELLSFLYTDKYLDSLDVFRVFIIVQMLRFTYFGMLLNAIGKTRAILVYSIISLIVNVIVSLALIKYGIMGPAIAALIGVLTIGGLQLVHSIREIECSIFELINLLDFAKSLFIITIVFGISYFVKHELLSMGFNGLQIMLYIGPVYCIVLFGILLKKIQSCADSLNY